MRETEVRRGKNASRARALLDCVLLCLSSLCVSCLRAPACSGLLPSSTTKPPPPNSFWRAREHAERAYLTHKKSLFELCAGRFRVCRCSR